MLELTENRLVDTPISSYTCNYHIESMHGEVRVAHILALFVKLQMFAICLFMSAPYRTHTRYLFKGVIDSTIIGIHSYSASVIRLS